MAGEMNVDRAQAVSVGRLPAWRYELSSVSRRGRVIGTATFVLVGRLIGQEFLADIALIPVLVVVCVGGMILSPVAFRAMAWALGMDRLPWATTR